jgi:hypothetical protein
MTVREFNKRMVGTNIAVCLPLKADIFAVYIENTDFWSFFLNGIV